MPKHAPFGSWQSPITARLLTAQSVRLSEPHIEGSRCYWLESRPAEQGRNALVAIDADGQPRDLLPAPHSVRTRAHEYGGGAYTVHAGVVYCVLDQDQKIYRIAKNGELNAISPDSNFRYADLTIDIERGRLICVREDHTDSNAEERNEIIALALDGSGQTEVLVTGADFYSNPRISPDGRQLCWLSWNHPQMPWDGTECWIAQFDPHGALASPQKIAGNCSESVFQPQWSPGGELFFVSDKTGWWNLYCRRNDSVEIIVDMPAEFATPQWVFGMSTYGFLTDDTLLCCYNRNGQWHLASIDVRAKKMTDIACDLTDISGIACTDNQALLLGANPRSTPTLFQYHADTQTFIALARSLAVDINDAQFSQPQPLTFATRDRETAHGFYYPPHNPDYLPPDNSCPPLIVMCHGGPTGATESSLNFKIQYWTSRGFAVLDVNYRGSTGYGRQYRDRLKSNWGITDIIDVCSGVDYLIANNLADAKKIAIRGSSAGGYTVLAALTFSNQFSAGASLYGIGDLETLLQDTHKFESRYLDGLIGPYPEKQHIYRARSPIHHIDKLQCPVIFLQGLRDKVVPPNQAQAMVDALIAKGIANAYVTFSEEGHGFRHADSIKAAIEAELFFYSRIFNFELAEAVTPVHITHFEEPTT